MPLNIPRRAKYRKRLGALNKADFRRDDSVLDLGTAKRVYNFETRSGALRDGTGVIAHRYVPIEARRYWVYRYYKADVERFVDQYVFQLESGHFMYYDETDGRVRVISGIAYPPAEAINYRLNSVDVLLISCEGKRLITWNGTRLTQYADSPEVSSMAVHYERLFVTSRTEPTKVFFSDDLDPTNWNISSGEGGFIELLDERGELNKVVSFADYLYIFRDHGISRVTAYGDQSAFTVTNLYVSAGRIYPESIAICGSMIVFAASDGLYVFDGYDSKKVLGNLDGLLNYDTVAASAYFNGKYYLSCGMNFGDGLEIGCEESEGTVNGLLSFDTATGEYSITRGLDISQMNVCTFLGEDFCFAVSEGKGGVLSDKSGSSFDGPLPKHWESPFTDLDMPDKTKIVREIYVKSSVDFTLSVSDGKKTKRYAMKAGDRRVRPNLSCRRFNIAIDTVGTDCNIAAPTIVYSVN